jgi:hypothetical protein
MLQRSVWGIVGLAMAVAMAAVGLTGSQAQSGSRTSVAPENYLPARPLVYWRLDGTAVDRQAWEQTAAYESLVSSGLLTSLDEWFVKVLKRTNGAESIRPLLSHIAEHGVSLSVSTIESAKGDDKAPPAISAIVVFHLGAELLPKMVQGLTDAGFSMTSSTVAGRTVQWDDSADVTRRLALLTDGGHLIAALGTASVDQLLAIADGKQPGITSHPQWTARNTAPAKRELNSVGWVEFGPLFQTLEDYAAASTPNLPAEKGLARALEVFGLNALDSFVSRQGFDGNACWSESELTLNGPLTGLMSLFDGPPLTMKQLPQLPGDASSIYVSSIDVPKVYDSVMAAVEAVMTVNGDEADWQKFQQSLDGVEASLGFRLRGDLLANLGQVQVLFSDPANGVAGFGGGMAVSIKDQKVMQTAVDALIALIPTGQPTQPRVAVSKKRGRQLVSVGQPGFPVWPTVCVDKNWLLIGLSPKTVESFLARIDGKAAGWKPSEAQQIALGVVPKEFVGLQLTDPREMLQGLPTGLATARATLQGSSEFPADFPWPELPSTLSMTTPLFPNTTTAVRTKTGVQWSSRTSLPGLPLLGSLDGPSIGSTSILVALTLPAVQQARTAARMTQSRNNLKQIGLALHRYLDSFEGFPHGAWPSAGEPTERLSWMASVLPLIDQLDLWSKLNYEIGWNEGSNQAVNQVRLSPFRNPALPESEPSMPGLTDYVGLAGLGKDGPTLDVADPKAGAFGYDQSRKLTDFRDGTAFTLMVGEISKDRGPWAQGGRSTIRPLTERPYINGPDGFGGVWQGGTHFLYADGRVSFISNNIDPVLMEKLTTINGGEAIAESENPY